MSNLVPGIDYVFYLYNGVSWVPYACARSGDFTINTEFLETTVTGSGNYKTSKPTVHSWGKTIEGIISFDDSTMITLPQLHTLQLAKTRILTRVTLTSQLGDVYIREGYCYIESSTDTGSFDGIATFRIAFRGTGAITQIYVQPPAPSGSDMRYPEQGNTAPATTGAYTWTATGLAGKYILGVFRDGRGSSDIITSGTPVGNEVLYQDNGADGDFTWPFPFEDGETPPYVIYRNQ